MNRGPKEHSRPGRMPIMALCAVCFAAASPGAEPFQFRDVAGELGLVEPLRGMMAHSAAWGDVNGDGRIDLFVGSFADRPAGEYRAGGADGPVANKLLLNLPGGFEESHQPALAWLGRASGNVLADLDNDGWPDLYVANNGRLGSDNLLYRNLGQGRFENVTAGAGAPMHLPETARSTAVLDFDGDGLLDLLVLSTLNRGKTMLFRNRGGMKFEVSDAIPGDATGLGLAVGDVTGNGWPDVMIGGPNRLFVNQGGGRFREATELNLDWGFSREDESPSCGVAFGDIDRDGRQDMLIGSHHKAPWKTPNRLRLFHNRGSTPDRVRFEEVSEAAGLGLIPMKLPHVEIRDFDNDGWPDLYTALAVLREGHVYPCIYRNLGGAPGGLPRFEETALKHRPEFPGPDDYVSGKSSADFYDRLVKNRRVVYCAPGPSGDFDNDGKLDLFFASWFPQWPSMLLRNETSSGHYLAVEIAGPAGVNPPGIGSMVRAYLPGRVEEPAALLASEEIASAYGFCSAQPPVAHLGLGSDTTCDLVVILPHGKGKIIRRNVRANQRLKL